MTTLPALRQRYFKQVIAIAKRQHSGSCINNLIKASVGVIPRGKAYRRLLNVEYPK